MPEPGGAELRAAAAALEAGARTEDVLERLRDRAADPGWDTLVAAALLQRDAGGDLARLLRDVAAALEDGARARLDARGATAQARGDGDASSRPCRSGRRCWRSSRRPGSLARDRAAGPPRPRSRWAPSSCRSRASLVVRRLARTEPRA